MSEERFEVPTPVKVADGPVPISTGGEKKIF